MRGLMMDTPLLISSLLRHAAQVHSEQEVVTRTVEGPIHRYTYAEAYRRAMALANALSSLGVQRGERIATLAWNTYRHLELYFAISGAGAVCHTINPRLFASEIAYIIDHAEDQYVFVDLTFVPLLEKLAGELKGVKGFVIMTEREHMPQTALANVLCYEELLEGEPSEYDWPELDENTASSLCYTSGTTGNPKGVLFSHRTTVLHAFGIALPDGVDMGQTETLLPVVPMFHVNAWGTPYAGAMTGCKLVMPGPKLDGESVYQLLEAEAVTVTAGVPTVWMMLLKHLKESGKRLSTLRRLIVGGSAAPRPMIQQFQDDYGVEVRHAWGMTETSPVGTVTRLTPAMREASPETQLDIACTQGRPVFGVELKICDAEGRALPHDGTAFGELKARGLWVCSGYYKLDRSDAHAEPGWFATGDVATIDAQGYMEITDRTKDVIKSGGEWISSIELENIAVGHPSVAEAAVIGIRHPEWDERPLLVVTRTEGAQADKQELLEYFQGKTAKWRIPDDVAFVDELPHTATGKLSKLQLRQQFKDYRMPTAE